MRLPNTQAPPWICTSTGLGADLSRGQLAQAARKTASQPSLLVEANAAATPFASGSFDCVVIPHALHEMPRETRVAVLREARRALRPGGRVAVLELDDPPSRLRKVLLGARLLGVEGPLQREGLVIHVIAKRLVDLSPRLEQLSAPQGDSGLDHAAREPGAPALYPSRNFR